MIAKIQCESLETSGYVHHEYSAVCETKQDGIYADYASECKKFFVCEKNQMFNFDCPPSTRFYERFETCSFVPEEELKYFVCNSPNQLKESASRQSLHALDPDYVHHVTDRRSDMSRVVTNGHPIEVMKVESEHDLDYLKLILKANQLYSGSRKQGGVFVEQDSEAEEGNKFREEKDGDGSHSSLYHVVPFRGHDSQHHRVLEPVMSPQSKPSKPIRVSKKLSPCQKAASSRRNDRKSKRFERSIKCPE